MKNIVRILIKWIWLGLVFFVALELITRLGDSIRYDAPFRGVYTHLRLRCYDSDDIQHNIPHARFERWYNDSLGFRGDEISLEKPAGIYRIVCMGASESYGLYENQGKEWPKQLIGEIDNSAGLEIVNASVVGLSFIKYQPYFEKYVKKITPDMVILLINPCSYVIEHERLINKPANQAAPPPAMPAQPKFSLSSIKEFISDLRITDKLAKSFKRLIPNSLLDRYQLELSKKQVAEAEKFRLANKSPYDTMPEKYLESYRNDLQALIDCYQANHIKVVLTSYPTLICDETIDKYPEYFLGARRFGVELSLKGMIDVTNKVNQLNHQVAAADSLDFVVLNEVIPHTKEYFADNVHFTDKGAELIARQIATEIKKDLPR
jgi:hypothetical protein